MKSIAILVVLGGCWSKPILPPNDHLDDPIHLVAGQKHACWIASDATLWCWGDNRNSQLGESPIAMTGTPVLAKPGAWDSVAAGARHTCAINNGDEIYCWGDDSGGQVGHSMETNAFPTKIVLPNAAAPAKIFAGDVATCAIDDAGLLYCWGTIDLDRQVIPKPRQIKPGNVDGPWRSVAIGDDHACALHDSDNLVYCWGKAEAGQLGVDNDRAIDQAIPREREFVAISAGHAATCGITIDRELVCFGSNARGLIGPSLMPTTGVVVDATRHWTSLALGTYHTCAVGDVGVYCFGKDDRGALGDGFEERVGLPPSQLLEARRVVAGEGFSCAHDAAGSVSCWGSNAFGELGNRQIATKRHPIKIPLPNQLRHLTIGDGHTCALLDTAKVYCWGDNRARQVNRTSSPESVTTPTLFSQDPFLAISAGDKHTCGIDDVSRQLIHCWGSNASHQLGTSDGEVRTDSISSPSTWRTISAGKTSTCAVTNDGRLGCWGDLPGTTTTGVGPTAATDTAYTDVVLGDGFAIGSFNSSTATQQNIAQLGKSGDCNLARPFPGYDEVLAGRPGNTWRLAAALDGQHVCVIDNFQSTHELFCWGVNTSGEIGVAPSACEPLTPIAPQVGSMWADSTFDVTVSVGLGHSCATDVMGDLYCWGANNHGELADLPNGRVPRRIQAANRFVQVATGPNHTCASDGGGGLYCWGENRFGEVGDGESFHPEPHAIDVPH